MSSPRAAARSKTRLSVAVQKTRRSGTLPGAAEIRSWVAAAAGADAAGEVTVRIVGEEESAALNARYRGKSGPTNVLAFPAEAGLAGPDEEPLPLGDVVVCAPLVESEARQQGKTPLAHWAHIVMHGTLHLVGYDHDRDADARVMEDKERELLARFGLPDPYSVERQ